MEFDEATPISPRGFRARSGDVYFSRRQGYGDMDAGRGRAMDHAGSHKGWKREEVRGEVHEEEWSACHEHK